MKARIAGLATLEVPNQPEALIVNYSAKAGAGATTGVPIH